MNKEIPFKTAYSAKKREFSPTGDGTTAEYGYTVDSYGRKVLVETGRKNTYEEIQSYAEECKIENILARAAIGDMSDFRPDGIYQDITNMPTNMIEARKQIVALENTWTGLSKDLKAKYNWSMEEFIAKAGEKSWLIDMGLAKEEIPIEETPKIKAEETKIKIPKETE